MSRKGRYWAYKPSLLKNNVSVAYTLSLSDSVTLSDAISKQGSISKSDSITLSDNVVKTINLLKSDSVTLSDIIQKAVALSKTDSIILSDAISIVAGLSESDSIVLSDIIEKSIELNESDNITLTDFVSIAEQLLLTLSDSLLLSDDITIELIPVPPHPIEPPYIGDGGRYEDKEHDVMLKRKIIREDVEIEAVFRSFIYLISQN